MKTFIGLITSLPPTGFSSGVTRALANFPVLCPKCLKTIEIGAMHRKLGEEQEVHGKSHDSFPVGFKFETYEQITLKKQHRFFVFKICVIVRSVQDIQIYGEISSLFI